MPIHNIAAPPAFTPSSSSSPTDAPRFFGGLAEQKRLPVHEFPGRLAILTPSEQRSGNGEERSRPLMGMRKPSFDSFARRESVMSMVSPTYSHSTTIQDSPAILPQMSYGNGSPQSSPTSAIDPRALPPMLIPDNRPVFNSPFDENRVLGSGLPRQHPRDASGSQPYPRRVSLQPGHERAVPYYDGYGNAVGFLSHDPPSGHSQYPERRHSLYPGRAQPYPDRSPFSNQPHMQMGMEYYATAPAGKRRRGNLPKETTDFLRSWLEANAMHPYPSDEDKAYFVKRTGLNMSQVSIF
jgi:Homeobox KN domain